MEKGTGAKGNGIERTTDVRTWICRCCGADDYVNVYLTENGEIDEAAMEAAPATDPVGYCRDCGPELASGCENPCPKCADLREDPEPETDRDTLEARIEYLELELRTSQEGLSRSAKKVLGLTRQRDALSVNLDAEIIRTGNLDAEIIKLDNRVAMLVHSKSGLQRRLDFEVKVAVRYKAKLAELEEHVVEAIAIDQERERTLEAELVKMTKSRDELVLRMDSLDAWLQGTREGHADKVADIVAQRDEALAKVNYLKDDIEVLENLDPEFVLWAHKIRVHQSDRDNVVDVLVDGNELINIAITDQEELKLKVRNVVMAGHPVVTEASMNLGDDPDPDPGPAPEPHPDLDPNTGALLEPEDRMDKLTQELEARPFKGPLPGSGEYQLPARTCWIAAQRVAKMLRAKCGLTKADAKKYGLDTVRDNATAELQVWNWDKCKSLGYAARAMVVWESGPFEWAISLLGEHDLNEELNIDAIEVNLDLPCSYAIGFYNQ